MLNNPIVAPRAKIVFSPHPVIETFQISGIDGVVKLVISDLHCRILLKKEIVCDEIISLKEIPRGIYVVQLSSSDGVVERRKLEKK
jgi:hypothetical protein